MRTLQRGLVVVIVVLTVSGRAFGYGDEGHTMVGAVADARLANDTDPAAATARSKIQQLIGPMSLAGVAILPDKIKDWDKTDASTPASALTLVNNPPAALKADLWDFVKNNRQLLNGEAFHHTFHYCDVPVVPPQKYGDGEIGRQDHDVVHMISICLQARKDPNNPEAKKLHVTQGVALVLLSHYLGDIHQPLHVGSLYFDANGPADPAGAGTVCGDQGGNKLQIVKLGGAQGLHHYWDVTTVTTAVAQMKKDLHLPDATDAELAGALGKKEPASWKTSGDAAGWSQKWADEILPIAQEAHSRLDFGQPVLPQHPDQVTTIVSCPGAENPGNSTPYKAWSGGVVEDELHKAGWRLAEILKEAFK